MLFDPFYGVFDTSTKIAHFLNRLVILIEFGALASIIIFVATGYGATVWGWIGICVGGVLAIHVTNLALRFLWSACLTFVYGTTDADEIVDKHDRKLLRERMCREERQRRLEDEKMKRNRAAIEKEWDDSHEASFE